MNTQHGLDALRRLPPGSVLSIGNFDGLHLGHREILRTASTLRAASPSRRVAVATFEPHPLTVLRPDRAPPRLTPPDRKRDLLEQAGVDEYVVLPPTPDVLNLTAEQFWQVLRDEARPAHLVEGESFNFGKGRGGSIDRLREWTAGSPVRLHVVPPVTVALLDLQIVPASSSLVRWLVAHGRMRDAAICLGRPYELVGPVVKGHQRGRTIGMPTANLDCGDQLVPADGVYAGRCEVGGRVYPVALSVGTMPTFGANARQVEAHLVGFEGDLYGRTLGVEVLDWLREQRKFGGIDALKAQLAEDVRDVVARAGLSPETPVAAVAISN
jgi:riboflavin kinase / FMN adenylyltransferase